jgi:hypothetical protein
MQPDFRSAGAHYLRIIFGFGADSNAAAIDPGS